MSVHVAITGNEASQALGLTYFDTIFKKMSLLMSKPGDGHLLKQIRYMV